MSRVPTDEDLANYGAETITEMMREDAELHERQAEKQLAGIAAGWHKQLAHVRNRLKPHYIVDDFHRAFYLTGLEMLDAGLPEDFTLFLSRLEKRTNEPNLRYQMQTLVQGVQNFGHLVYYADLVIIAAERRECVDVGREVQQLVKDGAEVGAIHSRLKSFLESRGNVGEQIGSFSAMAKKKQNQELHPVVIDGIGREGETINIVSDSKVGKSWLMTGLALSVCGNREWLGFPTQHGKVLILDNELHEPTLVYRIRQVARAMGLQDADFDQNLHVECFRGRLIDINTIAERMKRIAPGTYKAVILDSLYRFAPKGFNENDNGHTTEMYNTIDAMAAHLRALVICVRHTSKGNQSSKAVTDVGAGAGAQSRAADCHLAVRAHEQDGAFVMQPALRSFPKMEPLVVRFEWPVFFRDDTLDASLLAPDRPKKAKQAGDSGIPEPGWTPSKFVDEFLAREPKSQATIIAAAVDAGLAERRAKGLLRLAADCSPPLAFQWLSASDRREKHYANVPQTTLSIVTESAV